MNCCYYYPCTHLASKCCHTLRAGRHHFLTLFHPNFPLSTSQVENLLESYFMMVDSTHQKLGAIGEENGWGVHMGFSV
jgi:hypothetical protein